MQQELKVSEIFYSIQGESSYAGRPCVFVRLAGCPLDCAWCDTQYARSDFGAAVMTIDEIAETVSGYGCELVELTGGEPLAQPAAVGLLRHLAVAGYKLLLETSGALDISATSEVGETACEASSEAPSEAPGEASSESAGESAGSAAGKTAGQALVRIMDVKCPSSNMADSLMRSNFDHLRVGDELKFVIADRADFDYALDILATCSICEKLTVNFSPLAPDLSASDLSAWILTDYPRGRLNLQLHRIIWPDVDRGV